MKLKIFGCIAILSVIFIFCSYRRSDDDNKEKVLMNVILQTLNSGHYKPVDINDVFSQKTYDLYIKGLDNNKKFLIAEDVEKLKKYQLKIDDESKAGTYEFFNLSNELIDKRIKEAEAYYKEILAKPFDFTSEETIELDGEKLAFAKDKAELKESWRKYMKYQTLIKLDEMLEIQEKAKEKKDTVVKVKSMEKMEAEAREKVLKSTNELFHRMAQIDRNDRIAQYVNTITSTFDPHTNYFPPKDKENFDIAISGQLEGIGATLQEKDGNIKVVSIVPGSPSWKEGQLKAEDIILKVGQGDAEPVDVSGMRLDEAVKLIRGKKGTKVNLTVKKLDATIVNISIIRDVVVLEETYAKSAILKKGKNIGYIKLPQFYADFNNKGGRHSSEDVKKEIAKLKAENVQGLILDLRNNGGGSLQDVVDMGGLFIKTGPIVQIKSSEGAPTILEDYDPNVQFDGPLVIMVNTFSASASEILAAAIQDYKRGVILGSSSTFGKGTVQRVLDLDAMLQGSMEKVKPLGAMKLTTQKFYRVNGGATQLKGVIPDIIVPDDYTYLHIGEKELDYPMQWDEIAPAKYNKTDKLDNLEEIKKNSKARIAANQTFVLVNENAHRLKVQSKKTNHTLNLVKFRDEQKKNAIETKKYADIQKEIQGLDVVALEGERSQMSSDTSKAARVQDFQKHIKKDIYINEAISIINDMKK